MTDQPTANTITPEELADLRRELAGLHITMGLRTCLRPGCLKQYDHSATLTGGQPARPEWSGEGWRQVTRGPATGSICPEHVDAVTAHLPRTVDLPNGRWMVACACEWMSRPQTYGGFLRPLWEEHLLLTMGQLEAPVTLAEKLGRLPLEEHTEDSLRELYEAVEDTEHDRAETYDAAQAMFKAWDWHRQTLGGVSSAIAAVRNMMRTSADFLDHRDWTVDRIDANLWAILIGWDDRDLQEVAVRHRWDEHSIKYVRRMHGYLAPITDPQPKEDQR
ncbi:hypothetical protein AB0E04_17275 [Streptomyces sp. NPDC048251]|uniref:hypothetical protein n=1 Tax=Streptomyces sp. NPDC048251 TaxID=3154501 RepID=UPI0034172F64